MKRKSLLFLLLFALLAPWAANAQTTITLTGDLTQAIVPGTTYTFYDSGGPDGDYDTDEEFTATFTCVGDITINFSQLATETSSYCSNWDYMEIYDGNASTGTLLGRGQTGCSTSFTTGTDIVAQSGTMTVVWYSDFSTTAAGWTATITGTAVATPKPADLTVSVTDKTATLGWTERGTATSWQICLNNDENNLIPAATNPFTLTESDGLQPGTTYSVKVRSVGTPNSDWTDAVNFTTWACAEPIIVNYSLVDSYGDGWNGNAIQVKDVQGNVIETLTITSGSSNNGTLSLCGEEYVSFVWVLGSYPGEASWTFTNNQGEVLFSGSGSNVSDGEVLYVIDNRPCPSPTGLAVNGLVATWNAGEATLWNLQYRQVGASEWSPANGLIEARYDFNLLNLPAQTEYEVQVQVDCGNNETSDWTASVNFMTPCATFSLPYSYGFEDASEFACWTMVDCNTSSGISTGASYIHEGSAAFCFVYNTNPPQYLISPEFEGTTGIDVSFYYKNSSTTWPETFQVGYSTTGNAPSAFTWGTEVTASDGNWALYEDSFPVGTKFVAVRLNSNDKLRLCLDDFYFEVPSLCKTPRDLATGNIEKRNVELSWTPKGSETAWQLSVNNGTPIDVTSDEFVDGVYVLRNLEPNTSYTVKVRANCGNDGESEWSEEINFITAVACPAPTVSVENITLNSAKVKWTSDAGSYNFRYRELEASDLATIILTVGSGWEDGSGYQLLLDADATAFGTIFAETNGIPADGVAGSGNWGDVAASVYDQFEFKIPVNADGALSTTNIVLNNSVTIQIPAGTYDWCVTNPTPGQRMWIAGNEGNTTNSRADDYVFEAGMTYTFEAVMVYDDEGYPDSDGFNLTVTNTAKAEPKAGPWLAEITGATSPTDLTGLTPDTWYEVQVQAVCGGDDGSSAWASRGFKTLSACEAPTALEAAAMPTWATLSWTGYQENYNIEYRRTDTKEQLFFEGFESGDNAINQTWTVVVDTEVSGVYQGLPHSGSLMYGFMASDDTQYIISPELSGLENGGSLEFYHIAYYCNATIKIGYSSTTADAITWGSEISVASGSDYSLYSTEVPAGTKYIGIQLVSLGDYYYFIDDFTVYGPLQTFSWIPVTNETMPYVIAEGSLLPETEYEWHVQGINPNCENGVTEWSEIVTFTTPGYCDDPTDLEATDITDNSATLNWTGYQNSFNVQYREAEDFGDISFYEFFDNGQGDWTVDNLEENNAGGYASGWDVFDGFFTFVYTTNPPQTLISPELDIQYPNSTLRFSYLAYNGQAYPETFKVGFSTGGNSVSDFEWGSEFTATNTYSGLNENGLGIYTVAVPDNAKYFAVQCTSYDQFFLILGDFIIAGQYEAPGAWIDVEANGSNEVTGPVTIEGLTDNTEYDWRVRGVDCDGEGSYTYWSNDYFFTEEITTVTQTIQLREGVNWVSFYVETKLAALEAALEEALPGTTNIRIKGQNSYTQYNGNGWRGSLRALDLAQMYMITVTADCEITLEDDPINPAELEINIKPGDNWIAFPFSESMTVVNAFASFPSINGDKLRGQSTYTTYNGTSWRGGLRNLDPGKGYIYVSGATETNPLVYPTTSKGFNSSNASNMPSLNKKDINLPEMQKKDYVESSNNSVTAKQLIDVKSKPVVRTDCKSKPAIRK